MTDLNHDEKFSISEPLKISEAQSYLPRVNVESLICNLMEIL